MLSSHISSQRWFSILMALWSTWVLLIIVVGMASVFLSDMRLSRLQYDSILSSTQAEWAFEYAMLKIRNHRDGFSDSMNSSSPDAKVFSWASARTDKVEVNYSIESQSLNTTFSARPTGADRYIIIPLFTGKCQWLMNASTSCDPSNYSGTIQVTKITELSTAWNPVSLSWSIVAMSGSQNISITWIGEIDGSNNEIWTMRLQWEACYDSNGNEKPAALPMSIDGSCPNPYNLNSWGESIFYFYDMTWSTQDFLTSAATSKFKDIPVTDPYLLIFSSWSDSDITLKTDKAFTLPEMKITTEARKGDALQSIRFTEDKSKYYDALKYGIYNVD